MHRNRGLFWRGEDLAAPALIDLEVVSVRRGLARGGQFDARRVVAASVDRAAPGAVGRQTW